MVRVVAPLVLLLTALLAGCAGNSSDPAGQEPAPEAFNDVKVTDTTGAIRGIVFDEAIKPIEGVVVTLTGGANKTTDKDGAFVFSGLQPGDYFLSASKLGYNSIQQSATVVAGQKDPPITKIQLAINPSEQPYAQLLLWEGFLQCGVMWSSGTLAGAPFPLYFASYFGANACGPLDGRFIGHFALDNKVPDFVQAEAIWDGTQPLSNDLTLGFWLGGSTDWKFVYGKSPLTLTTNRTEIIDAFEDENLTDLPMRMFPGQSDEPASLVVTTNQAFRVYQTQFYKFAPREGWTFIVNGQCSVPSDCA